MRQIIRMVMDCSGRSMYTFLVRKHSPRLPWGDGSGRSPRRGFRGAEFAVELAAARRGPGRRPRNIMLKHALSPQQDSKGLGAGPLLARLRWRLEQVAPFCLHSPQGKVYIRLVTLLQEFTLIHGSWSLFLCQLPLRELTIPLPHLVDRLRSRSV